MIKLVLQMFINLVLTIFIELGISLLLGIRKRNDINNIIYINCITNIVLNYIINILSIIFYEMEKRKLFWEYLFGQFTVQCPQAQCKNPCNYIQHWNYIPDRLCTCCKEVIPVISADNFSVIKME